MKKALLSFGLLALVAGASVSIQSCNKIKDEIAKHIDAFTFTQAALTYDIPVLADQASWESGFETYTINVNEIIKEEAGVDFDIDNISTIKIKEINIHLQNADAENNWTNFEQVEAWANTDKGMAAGKNDLYGKVTTFTPYDDVKITVDQNINFKDYLNGDATVVTYKIKTKAIDGTNHPLTAKVTVSYEFKP